MASIAADRDDVGWHHRALAERFSILLQGRLADELCRAVRELERLIDGAPRAAVS